MSRAWRSEEARPAGSGVTEFGSSWSWRRFQQAVGRSERLQSWLQPVAGRGGWAGGPGRDCSQGAGAHQALWALYDPGNCSRAGGGTPKKTINRNKIAAARKLFMS